MKSSSEKAKRRLESKKRKVSAFLQVAELNDAEKRRKILDGNEDEVGVEKPKVAGPSSKGPLLSGDSYQELRERLRARKKLLMQLPDFDLKTVGHSADVDMHENYRTPLFIKDLQHLLLYALMGSKAPVEPSRWCKFTKWNKLTGVVCLVIDGVGLKDFHEQRAEAFSGLSEFLKFKLEFLSPAAYDSSIAQDFSLLPVSQHQKEKIKQKYGGVERAIEQGSAYRVLRSIFPTKELIPEKENSGNVVLQDDFSNLKLRLLLSINQMIEEGYPIPYDGPMREKFKDFVMTKSEYTDVTDASPLFSIDCEMCLTTAGKSELTKICVVDEKLDVVYQSFVKPKNHITNFLTRFSGITAEMLEGVTTTLEDVQKALIEILPPDAILIGQSLNSDLLAMQMMHPYVIDTSVIFCITGERRRKSKLSVLSSMFLGEKIQHDRKGSHLGHDPKEDAEAAMKLVLLKLEKGYNYGDVLLDGTIPHLKYESKTLLTSTLFNQAKDNNQSVCIVAQKPILKQYKKYAAGAVAESLGAKDEGEPQQQEGNEAQVRGVVYSKTNSPKETVEKACELTFQHNLTICHVDISKLETEASEKIEGDEIVSLDKRSVKYVKKWTEKLWSHTSQNGLFITVWPGDKNQNAFVGISLNKAKVPTMD